MRLLPSNFFFQALRLSIFAVFLVVSSFTSTSANTDLVRALENDLTILKGEKKINDLSPGEALEVLRIHARLSQAADGCRSVIESQIDGEFTGWEGETIFKLYNGQIWQQTSYSYTYHYAYNPDVIIYPSKGSCKMKVDGVKDAITVQRLR